MDTAENYGLDLPSDTMLSARLRTSVNYWRNRNRFVVDVRDALNGLNKIEAPVSAQYKVKVLHCYILASLVNEKTSRFLSRPVIQTIPDDDFDDDSREKSTRIERAINVGWYEIERRTDADAWSRTILDAILLDEGVSKTLRAANAFWTDLVRTDTEGTDSGKGNLIYPFNSDQRTAYKKEHGVPLSKSYVPLEYFYPTYDGPTLIESFENEERTLISVLNNPLFQNAPNGALEEIRRNLSDDGGLSQTANIIQYANNNWHGYYLAGPGENSGNTKWPKITPGTARYTGNLKLLYSYEHGLGRSLYNCVGGRFGGWKTSNNRIEGVGKGLLELCQAADEIVSQVLTNVRAKYWPSLNFRLDPEQRGFGVGNSRPEAPTVKEGEPIVTYIGEEILPIFKPEEDPMAMWLFDKIQEQVGKLGGSSVLFGGREPGVDTGYHQAIQQTQAESLDNKLEQHIAAGGEQEAVLMLLHAKKLNEKIYMHYAEVDEMSGRKKGKYVELDPDDLTPLPRMDVKVRNQRPVDYIAALRAAREASDDRGGKGPLLSDDTIRQDILSIEGPDIEYNKIIIESQKREIISNGMLSAKIGEKINIKLATTGIPSVSPEMLSKADPALIAAIKGGQGAAAQQGGTDPALLAGVAEQSGLGGPQGGPAGGMGLPPGPATGDPEEMNRLGEAVQGAMQTGASSI